MKHTGNNWKVAADPEKQGLHPLHDNRFIVTDDAEFIEYESDGEMKYELLEGSIICQMKDTFNQPNDARLIAAAPELLETLKDCVSELQRAYDWMKENDKMSDVIETQRRATLHDAHALLDRLR